MIAIIVLLFCSLSFAAVQHNTVFPIESTEAYYTIEDNSYDATSLSTGVRFSFTAPADGYYSITVSENSGGDFYLYSCTNDTYSSCKSLTNFYGSSKTYTSTAQQMTLGETNYYKVTDYNTDYSHKADPFSILYNKAPTVTLTSESPNCSTSVTSAALTGSYSSFTGYARAGYSPNGWEVTSGTALVSDSTFKSISVRSSEDFTLTLKCKENPIYPLTSTPSGFTFDKNSSTAGNGTLGIRASYTASDSGYYALITNTSYSYSLYKYGNSAYSAYSGSYSCSSNGQCKIVFLSDKNATTYFLMSQTYNYHLTDSIYAHVTKAQKVNADTSGSGYAYVGVNSRNYDSTYVVGDTVPLSASSTYGKFDHWETVSGNCSILDSTLYTTSVVIQGDCRVKAVFGPATTNAITSDIKKYTTEKDFSTGTNYSSGIRYFFTAPTTGSYIFNFNSTKKSDYNVYKYPNGSFNSYSTRYNSNLYYADTLRLHAGDSVFYMVSSYYASYKSDTIEVNYTTTDDFIVTLTSNSTHCTPSSYSDTTRNNGLLSFSATADAGYRPNGWKFLSGTKTVRDSSASKISINVQSNIELQLQCKVSNLIEIDDTLRTYSVLNDFYEIDSTSGIRFRYISPTDGPYIIFLNVSSYDGYFFDYLGDSTFADYDTKYNYYNKTYYLNFTSAEAGESHYFKVTPYSNSYYGKSFSIRAAKPLYVKQDTVSTLTRVVSGDSLGVSATIPYNSRLQKWTVVSGTGTFRDSSVQSTYYFPQSDTSQIKAIFEELPIYELSDKWRSFSILKQSSNARYTKGIRASFTANTPETYVLQIEKNFDNNNSFYIRFFKDTSFSSSSHISYSNFSDSTYKKALISTTPDSTFNILFYPNSFTGIDYTDSIRVRVVQSSKIILDTIGNGSANFYTTYSAILPGDSIKISASSTTDSRFSHWEITSGKCTISDSTKASTSLYVTGDCKATAVFVSGTIYDITTTPTEYTTAKHYYSVSPSNGVRFKFVAPDNDSYTFVVSRAEKKNLRYYRYPTGAFQSYSKYNSSFNPTFTEKVTLAKGDTAFFIIQNYNSSDSLEPFWISASNTESVLTITADSTGYAAPSKYSPIANNAKYGIYAYGTGDYRFDKWENVSGKTTIDNVNAPRTLVSVQSDAEIKATFKQGRVYNISQKYKTFNFLKHYYSDNTNYSIRMTWTPPDTNSYVIQFMQIDSLNAVLRDFKNDSTFSYSNTDYVRNDTSFLIKGTPNKPLYWSIGDYGATAADKDFKVKIGNPYILNVVTPTQGTISIKGAISMLPFTDTTITTRAYGGYVFDKWVVDSGKVEIEDPKKASTRFTAIDSFCTIHPTYVLDLTVQPDLHISGIDLSAHPSICTQVNVTDQNTGRTIVGLDSSDFILFQDNQTLPIQATTIQEIGGVSVALVIDESVSMDNGTRDIEAIKAINEFIDGMGPYDRTALVGFGGHGDLRIHQTMTSNKDSLYNATANIKFNGSWTNINEGTELGVQQIIGEINPTAVIVFSDGINNDDNITSSPVIDLANANSTNIYTIGLESNTKDPLQTLAEGTGGTYTYATAASMLSGIYETIRNAVQARYVICYESPDNVLNSDVHNVEIKTNFNSKNASDTFDWSESAMPPKIRLTQETQDMIGVSQNVGDSIVIEAYITSLSSISTAKIYLRSDTIPAKTFVPLAMTHVRDSLWTYVIPAEEVKAPGYDFYITAEDNTGLIGKTPTIPTPSREPYTIPVGNDVAVVELVKTDCIDTSSGYGKVSFTISDTNGVYKSYLYYRDTLGILFFETEMTFNAKNNKWIGKIPSKHFKGGSVEYYVRAVDSLGTAVHWPKDETKYLGACIEPPKDTVPEDTIPVDTIPKDTVKKDTVPKKPEVKDSIVIVNAESAKAKISRSTQEVSLKIWSTSFSNKVDTVTATLKCLRSGDSESDIKMVEKKNGTYENLKTIYKDEYSAKKNNGTISCEAIDTLIAEYKNPKTKKTVYDTVAIDDFVAITYQFLEEKKDNDLDSVQTSTSAKFRLRVTTTSPKVNSVDTIKVDLYTNKGDTLTVKAVETDKNSAVFDYIGKFYFVEDSLALKDTQLDAILDLNTSKNRVKIQAKLDKDQTKPSAKDSLIIYTTYVPADSAEIYDKDLDGKADFVRVHFKKPLKKNITSIDTVFWPKSGNGAEYRKVKSSKIKVESDSSWVQATLEKDFKYGITAPDTEYIPYLRITKTKSDLSQKVYISDKVGAVPVKAEKRPGEILSEDLLESEIKLPPDTLVITLSEKIKRTGKKDSWKNLFRYSKSCEDTVTHSIKAEEPSVSDSGLTWTFVLSDYSIMVGNCIRAVPEADYIGLDGNNLGRGGVEISGMDGSVYLYEVRPNPPVSGLDSKSKWLPPKGKKFETVPDTLSTILVESISAYTADVYIYNNTGLFVNNFTQKFGYDGELEDPLRGSSNKREKLSYLHWNQRDENGRKIGTGIYIWKIFFKFKDGHKEIVTLKTGVRRNNKAHK